MFLAVLSCAGRVYSQSPNAVSPKFDAASVRTGDPFVNGVSFRMNGGPGTSDPGRITYTRVDMSALLKKAYDIRGDQLVGPDWLKDGAARNDADFYTITATMPTDTTAQQFQMMLQNLLAERFHLVVHHETKDFPGYQLVVANGGPKLKEAVIESDTGTPAPRTGPPGVNANGFPLLRPGSNHGSSFSRQGTWGMIRSTDRESMTEFATSLGAMVNESNGAENAPIPRVVDKTGLTGVYEFTLGFAGKVILPPAMAAIMDSLRAAAESHLPGPVRSESTATEPAEVGPNLFTALEKQLGLRLEKTKTGPVDIVTVDHLDRVPTEN